MSSFWARQNSREKILILIAFALALVVLGGQFVVKPLKNFPAQQKKNYEKAQSDLIFMRQSKAVLSKKQTGTKAKLMQDDLQSVITRTALDNDLKITRRQPNDKGQITLWLENATSVGVYTWVETLTSGYNITLWRTNINRNDDGTVSVQITFGVEN
jgi:type II secretory pathway component PulM